jgi:hypothetical protein
MCLKNFVSRIFLQNLVQNKEKKIIFGLQCMHVFKLLYLSFSKFYEGQSVTRSQMEVKQL